MSPEKQRPDLDTLHVHDWVFGAVVMCAGTNQEKVSLADQLAADLVETGGIVGLPNEKGLFTVVFRRPEMTEKQACQTGLVTVIESFERIGASPPSFVQANIFVEGYTDADTGLPAQGKSIILEAIDLERAIAEIRDL